MYKNAQGQIEETDTEARQAYLDPPVLVVLLVSTGLAVLGLIAMWLAS